MVAPDMEEEWELVSDGIFIYKRLKHSHPDPETPSSSSSSPASSSHPPHHDYAAEEKKILQERKRTALINLKHKYQTEILLWEQLSNTLKATCEKATTQQQIQHAIPVSSSDIVTGASEHNSTRRLIDELLSQAEIQGAMIANMSKLCDDAEALCRVQEERIKKQFMELPIWEKSPSKLISILCQD